MPRIIISEPGKSPQPYRLKLTREETKIGRGADNDIIIEAGSASTHHCAMKRVSGGFILEDLQSTNGIKIEGTRFDVIDLVDGITIHIGDDVTLDFTLSDEEQAELSTESFSSHQRQLLPPVKEHAPPAAFQDNDDFEVDEEDEEDVEFFADPPQKKNLPEQSVFSDSFVEDDEDEIEQSLLDRPRKLSHSETNTSRFVTKPTYKPKSNGALATLIFLILATLAFVGGMVIRHYQDHGTFLFEKK